MTKSPPGEQGGSARAHRCAWCGRVLLQPDGPGRPRSYCRQACRQQAYLARRLAGPTGTDGLVVDREAWDRMLDRRYELELAAGDVRRALAAADPGEADDAHDLVSWLLEHIDRLLAADVGAARA